MTSIFSGRQTSELIVCKIFSNEHNKIVGIIGIIRWKHIFFFCKRYFDLEELFDYPSPSNAYSSGLFDGVNDYGTFERAYKTFDDAKKGAMDRCGWQGLNEDTVIN